MLRYLHSNDKEMNHLLSPPQVVFDDDNTKLPGMGVVVEVDIFNGASASGEYVYFHE